MMSAGKQGTHQTGSPNHASSLQASLKTQARGSVRCCYANYTLKLEGLKIRKGCSRAWKLALLWWLLHHLVRRPDSLQLELPARGSKRSSLEEKPAAGAMFQAW